MPLDAHKPKTLSAWFRVIFFGSPGNCLPARGLWLLRLKAYRLADVLTRINDLPRNRLHELPRWERKAIRERINAWQTVPGTAAPSEPGPPA
jgi:hypothetical protein